MYQLKITVEDPLKVFKKANDSGEGNQTASQFEIIKAHLQILSITKDGMVTLKIKASRGGGDLCKLIQMEDLKGRRKLSVGRG